MGRLHRLQFVREFFQNVLDARIDSDDGSKKAPHVRIDLLENRSGLSTEVIGKLVNGLDQHLVAAMLRLSDVSPLIARSVLANGLLPAKSDSLISASDSACFDPKTVLSSRKGSYRFLRADVILAVAL